MVYITSQVPTARLSEENLRRHNESFSKIKRATSANGLRETRKSDVVNGQVDDTHDNTKFLTCKAKKMMALRKAASRDALGLYTGVIGSWDVKMEKGRPIDSRCDKSYRKAGQTKFAAGGVHGEVETLEPVDLRELVFDMVEAARPKAVEDDECSVGSLQASSDTLSVSRFREVSQVKKMAARRLGLGNCKSGRSKMQMQMHPTSAPCITAM